MTEERKNDLPLTLLITHPHQCSYLPDQQATTAFVDPQVYINTRLFTRLAEIGFRRSGAHVYRPQCANCQACIATRVPIQDFHPDRTQLRCLKRNADLEIRQLDSIDREDCYALYERYINMRHSDGDMYPANREQYREFLCVAWPSVFYLAYYSNHKLVAVSVCDRFENGYSAVYTFFDPDEHKRSLGVFAVLNQIARAQLERLDYLYLGYWIKHCNKMSYKIDYRPIELLINGKWQRLK
ncbi:MAG TPA: arginyltransferase [Pseudomonadales bacterium]|nr:arginyltransferase [Pseudomonadales bacterium]